MPYHIDGEPREQVVPATPVNCFVMSETATAPITIPADLLPSDGPSSAAGRPRSVPSSCNTSSTRGRRCSAPATGRLR